MKKTISAVMLTIAFLVSTAANAGQCGSGRIVDLKEGGWHTDDLMIKLEGTSAGASTLFNGYVRFSASTLSAARLDAIRRLATTAFALDAKVWTYSHTGTCHSATEISILQ